MRTDKRNGTHLSDNMTQALLSGTLKQPVLNAIRNEMPRRTRTYGGRNVRHQPIDETYDFARRIDRLLSGYCVLGRLELPDRSG